MFAGCTRFFVEYTNRVISGCRKVITTAVGYSIESEIVGRAFLGKVNSENCIWYLPLSAKSLTQQTETQKANNPALKQETDQSAVEISKKEKDDRPRERGEPQL